MRTLILPTWMYLDPSDVAERIQTSERRAHRAYIPPEPEAPTRTRPRANYGLVGAATVLKIKRARIRELTRRARK